MICSSNIRVRCLGVRGYLCAPRSRGSSREAGGLTVEVGWDEPVMAPSAGVAERISSGWYQGGGLCRRWQRYGGGGEGGEGGEGQEGRIREGWDGRRAVLADVVGDNGEGWSVEGVEVWDWCWMAWRRGRGNGGGGKGCERRAVLAGVRGKGAQRRGRINILVCPRFP